MPGKVIGVGSALVDQLAYVPEVFLSTVAGAKGGMELVDHSLMRSIISRLPDFPALAPGGSAANTAVGVARLGAPAGLLAKVGRDEDGEYYISAARAAGVCPKAFKRCDVEPTGKCLSLITPDSERTMRTFLGAAGTLLPVDVTTADFAGYDVVHIEGYLLFNPELIKWVLVRAREAGAKISLDLASPEVVRAGGQELRALVREYVDYLFANEEEAREYTGTADEEAGLRALADDVDLAALKVGPRGAWVSHRGKTARIQAETVQAVDTTGAGDSWAAGFLYGLGEGMDIDQAGHAGAMVSAEVVQVTGAALPDQTWKNLKEAIDTL
ncbi:MAG: adenosine kinase [Lentisphaeria bacterium]|nr:adenosine kinase [Lentisphaeria bacterium]